MFGRLSAHVADLPRVETRGISEGGPTKVRRDRISRAIRAIDIERDFKPVRESTILIIVYRDGCRVKYGAGVANSNITGLYVVCGLRKAA